MIRKISLVLSFLFVAGLILEGCAGTDVAGTEIGNPDDVSVSVVGLNSDLGRLSVLAQSTGTTVSEAQVVLAELQFKMMSAGNGNGQEANFKGPYVADLLNDQTTPDLGTVRIPPGRYKQIEMNFEKLEADEIPEGISPSDPIVGHSYYLEGSREDGVPFAASLELTEEFRLESDDGFSLGEHGPTRLFVAFDLSAWFVGVDLSSAQVVDDEILIDESHNTELLDILKENIKTSARLFEDQNENGTLDPGEGDDDDLLATGGL